MTAALADAWFVNADGRRQLLQLTRFVPSCPAATTRQQFMSGAASPDTREAAERPSYNTPSLPDTNNRLYKTFVTMHAWLPGAAGLNTKPARQLSGVMLPSLFCEIFLAINAVVHRCTVVDFMRCGPTATQYLASCKAANRNGNQHLCILASQHAVHTGCSCCVPRSCTRVSSACTFLS
jgi:hypothetical protein